MVTSGSAVTGLSGLVYLAVQQNYRMNANDPQIQMAEDAALALRQGVNPKSLLPGPQIEIARSLAPFLVIYDDRGQQIGFSGVLHGRPLPLPEGVLDYVRTLGEDRVTLQPESGVRIAAIIVRAEGTTSGFVLAGRSLRVVEERIDDLTLITAAALFVILAATFVTVAVCVLIKTNNVK